MSWRSIILGLIGVVLLAAFSYANDLYMRGAWLAGNFFPLAIVGFLTLSALFVHPLLRWLAPRLAMTRAETALVFGLLLFAAYVPGRGLGHHFTNLLMLPHHYARTVPAWQSGDPRLRADEVLDGPAFRERTRDLVEAAEVPAGALIEAEAAAGDIGRDDPWLARVNALIEAGTVEPVGPEARQRPEMRAVLGVPPAERTPVQRQHLARAAVEEATGDAVTPRVVGVLEAVPPRMLADPSRDPTTELDGFVMGMGLPDEPFGLQDIPWAAWRRTLRFWLPVVLTMALASIGLALVVHRQWTEHEHLPFPTMAFARSLLPEADGGVAAVLRQRAFWIGLGMVVAIHLNNYLHVWWPRTLIPIQLGLDLRPLAELVPVMRQGSGWWAAFGPQIFFTIIGLAYFLANDVSLSLGVAPYLYAVITGVATGYGISFVGGRMQPNIESFMNSGAFAGLFVMLVYSGRHYYRSAFGRGLGLRAGGDAPAEAVWGARAAMFGFALLTLQIAAVGVTGWMAALYTFWLLLVPLVLSRLLAESGVFFLNPRTYPCAMLWGVLGAASMGRQPLLVLGIFSLMLIIYACAALMPFAVSALRIADESGVRVGKAAMLGMAAVAVAVAVMVPSTLRVQYRHGAFTAGDHWTQYLIPRWAVDNAQLVTRQLDAQGVREASDARRGWQRIRRASPHRPAVTAFGIALVLVLLFGFARHRFPRWPLHPVLFAVMGIWPSSEVGFSFLLGWAVKALVMKYGGARLYRAGKPLMIGLIAGEVLGALIPAIVGLIHYGMTGEPAPRYTILPG